jgi:hypothetical protein
VLDFDSSHFADTVLLFFLRDDIDAAAEEDDERLSIFVIKYLSH